MDVKQVALGTGDAARTGKNLERILAAIEYNHVVEITRTAIITID